MKSLVVFAVTIFLGVGSLLMPAEVRSSDIDFRIGINLGVPIRHVAASGPYGLYPIPGMPVYYVPDIRRQTYFYSDNWYRLYNGYWYRAVFYNGPWMFLQPESLPRVFMEISPDYYVFPHRDVYTKYWKHKTYRKERDNRHDGRREHLNRHHDRERDAMGKHKREKRWQ